MKKYFTQGNLFPVVKKILSKKNSFIALTNKHKTPFYVYDEKELNESIDKFNNAFRSHLPRFQSFYALKLNHHPLVINGVVKRGMGLDVASKRELSMAIKNFSSKEF